MSSRIKGITIEIGGETTGLQKALSDVNKRSQDIQKELKDVERLLKFDPGNVEALAQKQKLLSQQIENTTQKLDQLKSAQSQVESQFQSGDIGESEYRAFRREIEFTEGSLDKLRQSLSQVDNGASLNGVRQDLSQVSEEAENAEGAIEGLGGELTNLLAGAAAGMGIAEIIEQALDTSSLNTKIEISMEVPESSKASVKDAINTVSSYGVDAEAALEGVRRQWSLNKDASDEVNTAVVNGAATIAAAYSGVDFTELIQETNEISKALGISNEESLALTNSLLKTGFPPEQLDIIAEYGTQLQMAGYDAEEIQAIFAAGIETGTWNIDNLLDGIKEGRIKVAEFGQEVPKSMQELIKGTDISAKQLQEWGKAVATGGEGGSKAMQEIATALNGVDDETKKNLIGIQLFGTKYEDQGQNIIDTLINAKDATVDLKAGQDELNASTDKLNSDPAVQMQQAMADLKVALEPLLGIIAEVIGKLAEWVQNNPQLAATITAIVAVIGILIGIFAFLAPIISAIALASTGLTTSLAAIAGPVLIVIGIISALIALGVALYSNWDTIKAKAIEIWGAIKEFLSQTWQSIKETVSSVWTGIKEYFFSTWESIKILFNTAVTNIANFVKTKWENIKTTTSTIFTGIKTAISTIWDNIKSSISNVVGGIVSVVGTKFQDMKNAVSTKMGEVKSTISNLWNQAKSFLEGINLYNIGKNIIQGLINGIKGMISKVKQVVSDIATSIKNKITGALGIHSPSRVMMEYGEYTGEGLVLGIKSMIGDISKQSEAMANAVKPDTSNTNSMTSVGSSRVGNTVENIEDAVRKVLNDLNIVVPLNIDGKEFARAVSKYKDILDEYDHRDPKFTY